MSYLIGLDMGTSSVKAIVMTEGGEVVKTARGAFEYEKYDDGKIEIDADKYVDVCLRVIKELSESVDGDVVGVCASCASGNLLVLDKDMKPLTKIISWQDSRVKNEAIEVLRDIDADALYRKTGWRFGFNGFPLAQMCYIKKHTPEVIENCGRVCMSAEYLNWKLTGKWGISTSAGTPFYFIDQTTGEYVKDLLDVFGLDESKMIPVMDAGAKLGGVKEDVAVSAGLKAGTSVVLGSFDHPSAARGVGILNEGEMLLSCGTSWVAFFPVKNRETLVKAGMLIDPFLAPKDKCWGSMVSVSSLSEYIWKYVSRYIDDGENAYKILAGLALSCESGAGGLKIDPTEEADDAKLAGYSKEQIARAIMEGAVNKLKEKIESLSEYGIKASRAVMVGGPSENPMWIRLIEEMCGISVKVIHGAYAGAVGAAVLAGIGTGIYEGEADASEIILKRA